MAPARGLLGLTTAYVELTFKKILEEGFTLGVVFAKLKGFKTSSADSNEAHRRRLNRLRLRHRQKSIKFIIPSYEDDDDDAVFEFEDSVDERLQQLSKDPQDKDSGPYFLIGFAAGVKFAGGPEDIVRRWIAKINIIFPSAVGQEQALAQAISELPTHGIEDEDFLKSLKTLLLSRANEKILLLSACPDNAVSLRTDREFRRIKERIDKSTHRGTIELNHEMSCSIKAMSDAIRRYQPTILHFSGHATANGLCFENEAGDLDFIGTQNLTELMSQGAKFGLHTVLLNACYTAEQSDCIAKIVGRVVAMKDVIADADAIAFSEAFYGSIGDGYGPDQAFEWANSQLQFHNVPLERRPLIKHRAIPKSEKTEPILPHTEVPVPTGQGIDSSKELDPRPQPALMSNNGCEGDKHIQAELVTKNEPVQHRNNGGPCPTNKPEVASETTVSSPSSNSVKSDDKWSTDDSAPSTPATEADTQTGKTDVKTTDMKNSTEPEEGLSMLERLKLKSKTDPSSTTNCTAEQPRQAANAARSAPNSAPKANPAPAAPSNTQTNGNPGPQTARAGCCPPGAAPTGRAQRPPASNNKASSLPYSPLDILLLEMLSGRPNRTGIPGTTQPQLRKCDINDCGRVLPVHEGGYTCKTCSGNGRQLVACINCARSLRCPLLGHDIVRVRYQA